jgi:glycosyltransferase involved in cell wall biosynthesis
MPDLYRCMDVFVLTSLFEMMPIALLEALASGLPCLVNRHPVLEWMVGTGGERPETTDDRPQTPDLKARKDECGAHVSRSVVSSFPGGAALDMARDGALAETLAGLTPAWIADHGRLARERALRLFDKPVVIRQYVEYYERVIA